MSEDYFTGCLYFTTAELFRTISKMAEESFGPTGLSPSYAFLLMEIKRNEGITPKELSRAVHIAPSTVTRLLDKLEVKKLILRESEGKHCLVSLTEKGESIQEEIRRSWKDLYIRYCDILGEEEALKLTEMTHGAARKLRS